MGLVNADKMYGVSVLNVGYIKNKIIGLCLTIIVAQHQLQQKDVIQLVVCGNRNFGSVLVFIKTEPNRILFVKPYFTVTSVLYKTVSDNNRYQTCVPNFKLFKS